MIESRLLTLATSVLLALPVTHGLVPPAAPDGNGHATIDDSPELVVVLDGSRPGTTLIIGAPAKDQLGNHLAQGDLNNDGIADLVAGAHWGSVGGRNNAGRAYALFGRDNWPAMLDLSVRETASWSFMGVGQEPRLGQSVAVGDLNGDGIDDLAIGSLLADPFGQNNAGAVFVMFGGPEVGGAIDFRGASPDLLIAGAGSSAGSDQMGTDLIIADFDGDGAPDLAVAAQLRDGRRGAVYGWWGPLRRGTINVQHTAPDWRIDGNLPSAYFGTALAAADLNDDGRTDLMVAAFSAEDHVDAALNSGAVYVFDGAMLRSRKQFYPSDSRTVVTGPKDSYIGGAQSFGVCSCHGQPLAAADLHGNGFAALVIGAPLADGRAGAAYVLPGPLGGGHIDLRTASHLRIAGAPTDARLGWSLATGDLDGDGSPDLVISATMANAPDGPAAAGRIFGIRGPLPVEGVLDVNLAPLELRGANTSDGKSGITLLLADTDGDGVDDLHVGMPGMSPQGRSSVGVLHRLPGPLLKAIATPTATSSPSITSSATPSATLTPLPTFLATTVPSSTAAASSTPALPTETRTVIATATGHATSPAEPRETKPPNAEHRRALLPVLVRGR